MPKRVTIKYGNAPRTRLRYGNSSILVNMATDEVVWRCRRNGACVVKTKRGYEAITGYGMDDHGTLPTLQAARTAAGTYTPSTRFTM